MELIEQLERAEGGTPDLDREVHFALGLAKRPRPGYSVNVPAVSASLDAALALAERVLPGVWWVAGRGQLTAGEAEYGAQLMFGEEAIGEGEGASAALSVCIAILRATQPADKQGEP